MYKHILIATDGSELAEKGVDHGLSLAKALDAKVTILTATDPFQSYTVAYYGTGFQEDLLHRYEASNAAAAKTILDSAAEKARRIGVSFEALHAAEKLPADAIIATAKEKGAELIVMASHGRRGVQRVLLGSQATEVVTSSELPVLIVR